MHSIVPSGYVIGCYDMFLEHIITYSKFTPAESSGIFTKPFRKTKIHSAYVGIPTVKDTHDHVVVIIVIIGDLLVSDCVWITSHAKTTFIYAIDQNMTISDAASNIES